jgi:hypothetical protein
LENLSLEFLHFEVYFWIPSPFICKGEGRVRVSVAEVSRVPGSRVCAKLFKNGFEHGIRIGEHLVVPKPQTLQKNGPLPICIHVFQVLPAVKFDDQAMVYRTESHDVWTY